MEDAFYDTGGNRLAPSFYWTAPRGALGRGSGSGSFEASAAAASSFLTRPGLSSLDDGLEHKTRTPDDSMVVRNVGGNWLFWNMTAGPSSPLSYDHNYYS